MDLFLKKIQAAIPVSDLGDSLDSRHLGESLNLSHRSNGHVGGSGGGGGGGGSGGSSGSKGRGVGDSGVNGVGVVGGIKSADSTDSADSGYDEYDENYSHIITERSNPELVRKKKWS